jgi:hypothetical protein
VGEYGTSEFGGAGPTRHASDQNTADNHTRQKVTAN